MNDIKDILKVINLQALDLPTFREVRGKDWVSYGEKNNFPNKLIELYQTSAIHGTAIQAKLDGVYGEGLANIGEELVNGDGETLNSVFEKVAYDIILFGGYSLNVIWNRAGDKIVEIYHLPFDRVRSGKVNEEDKVTEYYYSSNWNNTRKYPPISYPAFNMNKTKGEMSSQVFYYFNYTPGNDVYPLPTYIGAINDIQLDARISRFHNANISNGMSPGLFINLPGGDPSPDEKRKLYNDLVETFSSEENAGKLFLSFSEGKELSPEIQTIQGANDDYYITLEERISSRVLTAHRITSGMLVGIKDNVGLGNNSEEIETAYVHFSSTVIEPIQKTLTKSLNKITNLYGFNETLTVIPSTLDFNKNISENPQTI